MNPFAVYASGLSGRKRIRSSTPPQALVVDCDETTDDSNHASPRRASGAAVSTNQTQNATISWQLPKASARVDPAPATKFVRARRLADEDDDDLELLCVKPPPANNVAPARVTSLRSFDWQCRTRAQRIKIVEAFEQQLTLYLHQNTEALDALTPFMTPKLVEKILLLDEEMSLPPFPPAPRIIVPKRSCGSCLRDYQQQGVQFMLDRFHKGGLGCILADDMGLGKTAQLASFLEVLHSEHGIKGPHLIVCPMSTVSSWVRELNRWAPSLHVVKFHGAKNSRASLRHDRESKHSIFVTTPAVLIQDRGFFRQRVWICAVVDEAHLLKGDKTNISILSSKLDACMRIAATGTPVHNSLDEVWNLMSFVQPSLCRKKTRMGEGAEEACQELLKLVMLRRTKGEVELGIPPRLDLPTVFVAPLDFEKQLLDELALQVLRKCDDGVCFAHLVTLRRACNHPLSLLLNTSGESNRRNDGSIIEILHAAKIPVTEESIIGLSSKMTRLDGLLSSLKPEGHRVLIFSNFTTTLDMIEAMCILRHHAYERLDGGCTRVERELSVLRFNNPQSARFVFLITTTAGGVGITLTGADTVVIFDAHFNPQLDRQAADRAHRIGQTRPVTVYRFCLQGTIEERVQQIAHRKAELGDKVVEGGARAGDRGGSNGPIISADDIRRMLQHAEQNENRKLGRLALTHTALINQLAEKAFGEKAEEFTCSRGPIRHAAATTSTCFVCEGIMHPLEPLLHCSACPKSYHRGCIGFEGKHRVPWSCPRHQCKSCGKGQATDGAIFCCYTCPSSFCFECLPSWYFELDEAKVDFALISDRYPTMDSDMAWLRRDTFYVKCPRCSGMEPSSSSSSDDDDSSNTADDDSASCGSTTPEYMIDGSKLHTE